MVARPVGRRLSVAVRSTGDSNDTDIGPSQQKGAYRTFRERALAELEAREYVTVDDESVGRSDPITLTPTGEAALRAFRHKVLDVVEALDTHAAPDWLTEGIESE